MSYSYFIYALFSLKLHVFPVKCHYQHLREYLVFVLLYYLCCYR